MRSSPTLRRTCWPMASVTFWITTTCRRYARSSIRRQKTIIAFHLLLSTSSRVRCSRCRGITTQRCSRGRHMFITKKHVSRRTVLRGMGAMVTLPFLESMVPAMTPLRETAAMPPSRLCCVEVVHGNAGSTEYGTDNNLWMPAKEGRDFEFTPILKPLEQFRDYVTVISMMDCHTADPFTPEEVGADHFRSAAVFLSAAHPKQTQGSDVHNGTTIDQYYAQKFGQDTPLPSIQLCTENEDATGSCAFNYSCVYMQTISWSSPTTPLQMTYNP